MAPVRPALLLYVATLALVGACGPAEVAGQGGTPAGHTYADCDQGPAQLGQDRAAACQAFLDAEVRGRAAGETAAAQATARATADGYALRLLLSALLVVIALWTCGTLVAALLRHRFGRAHAHGYGTSALEALAREVEALRALAADGDTLVRHLVDRLDGPLGDLEARGRELARLCARLERRADTPTSRAHLAGLHDKLDALVARAERLHVQATVWHERHAGGADDEALEAAVAEALGDLDSALAEAAT